MARSTQVQRTMSGSTLFISLIVVMGCLSFTHAATPPYDCFGFGSGSAKAADSHGESRTTGDLTNDGDCPKGCTGKATIEPTGDINRVVGETYEAYCLFDSSHLNVSDVSFMNFFETKKIPHTVVNSSAIKIEVTHDNATTYSLWCVGKEGSHLCSRKVNIGYRPLDIANLTCVSPNYNNLTCTWDVPYNPIKTSYKLKYVIHGFKQSECPAKAQKKENSCFWDAPDVGVREKWYLHFNASNNLQESGIVYKHTINVYGSVLPDPVKQLKAHVHGPHNVTLSFAIPTPSDNLEKMLCEAACRPRIDGDASELVPWTVKYLWLEYPYDYVFHDHKRIYEKTITGLQPYIQYDFRVRLHTGFGEIKQNMWSDAVILTKITGAARPETAPKATAGTFEVEENLQYRDITINWQKVDRFYHNAPNFTYLIYVYDNSSNRLIAKDEDEVEMKESYAKFMNMEKDVTYRFEVIPVNDEGPPTDPNTKAVIFVPEKSAIFKQPSFFKVIAYNENNQTTYSVRWRVNTELLNKIETVTLYWCKKDKFEERCLNKLEWEIIHDPSETAKNITHLDNKALYMFGISINSPSSSSGIKWLTCIASYGTKPPPLEDFDASTLSATEVLLKWGLDCKAKAAEPIGFNISYCAVPEKMLKCHKDIGLMYEEIDDETAVEYRMKNLHPYTHYLFNIAILTQVGSSKWSETEHVITKPDKPSGPPTDLKVDDYGDSWVQLQWKPPILSQRNGNIIKYKVKWDNIEDFSYADMDSEINRFNITNLEPFTNYTFEVRACSENRAYEACGDIAASLVQETKIGVPTPIQNIYLVDDKLNFDHECTTGPECYYQIRYVVNSSEKIYDTKTGAASISLDNLNINCSGHESDDMVVSLRAVTFDGAHLKLFGPWKDESISCNIPGLPWWLVALICSVCIVIIVILVAVGQYGWDKIQLFLKELKRKPVLPPGMEDVEPCRQLKKPSYEDFWGPPISRDSISDEKPSKSIVCPSFSDKQECEDLIPNGGERSGRNLSGDSGTSEADPGDSSGCSTGGESVSSSGSDRVHQSSDSGTVQEESAFINGTKFGQDSGSLRQRIPGPPYVRQGLPDGMSAVGYVSASSVPNLAVGMSNESLSLQPFNPNVALSTLPEMQLGGRTSTGYISMPDDGDTISLDVLNKLCLPQDGRQTGFPAYSRHNFPYKKTPELTGYTKTGSLPWLNSGYVAVSQAESGMPQIPAYVGFGDSFGVMKRQPSLPSLPSGISKAVSTPEEDLPPGAYCKVGSRNSPGPTTAISPGYVGLSHPSPLHIAPNTLTTTSPINKSPYVTCAIAESLVSPASTPETGSAGYVSVGDLAGGRWAHPVLQPEPVEDSREVSSAPVEGSRTRPSIPTRPSTSDATVNHNNLNENQWPPLAPSLSKQSSGYSSQVTLPPFHDPVVMSPKRLLAQSHEPHSVVMSANHKASMV